MLSWKIIENWSVLNFKRLKLPNVCYQHECLCYHRCYRREYLTISGVLKSILMEAVGHPKNWSIRIGFMPNGPILFQTSIGAFISGLHILQLTIFFWRAFSQPLFLGFHNGLPRSYVNILYVISLGLINLGCLDNSGCLDSLKKKNSQKKYT